mmetsp:Transcript_5026/g.21374  ORF Transcript_5026/g.21374 Transcript_5026/m.21374 type:complete len:270 (+) Transcript_5026:742-1551(+)
MTPQVYVLSVRGTAQYSPTRNRFARSKKNAHPGLPPIHLEPSRLPSITAPMATRTSPAQTPGRLTSFAPSPRLTFDAYCLVMASINVLLAVLGRSDSRRCNTPASLDAVSSTDAAPLPILSTSAKTVSAFVNVFSSAKHAWSMDSAHRATARLAMVASRHARTSSRTATRKPATHAENTASASAPSAGSRSCAAKFHDEKGASEAMSPRNEFRGGGCALEDPACARFEPVNAPSSRAEGGGRRAAASRASPPTARRASRAPVPRRWSTK